MTFWKHRQHFLLEFYITINILGFSIFRHLRDWFRAQQMVWVICEKSKNKAPAMQTSDLFLLWRALSKRTWFSLKKVNFCTLGISLGYGCYGFGSTFQFLCGIHSLVICGLHSSVWHREMQSCFLLCSFCARETMFIGQMELWFTQVGITQLCDTSEHSPESKSRHSFRVAIPDGVLSAAISQTLFTK